jgi:hypothetical protein
MGPSLLPWNAPPRDTSAHSWSFSSSVFQSWRSTSNLAALSKSSRTPFTSTTSIGSCEVKLDEGRRLEERRYTERQQRSRKWQKPITW